MHILITGITGFVGSHLAELLLSRPGVSVSGTRRAASDERNLASFKRRLRLVTCDFKKKTDIERLLKREKPDRIFHLAACSSVKASWERPEETFRVNVLGTLHLFEALKKSRLNCRVLVAASSEEYGQAPRNEMPLSESAPLRPLSPYAVSKAAQDLMAYQFYKTCGIFTVRTRAFSHTGPRQSAQFVASDFSRQVALIEAGRQAPVLRVGNLGSVRDFTDVRDIVRAYQAALEHGEPGEVYNVCSGRGHAVSGIVDILLRQARVPIRVKRAPERARANDAPHFVGTAAKLFKRTGWAPKIRFEKTLADLLNDWRQRIASEKIPSKN